MITNSADARMITRNARKSPPEWRHVTKDAHRTRKGKRQETRQWQRQAQRAMLTGDWDA